MNEELIELQPNIMNDKGILKTIRYEMAPNVFISDHKKINDTQYYIMGISIPKFISDVGGRPTLKYISLENVFSCHIEKMNNKTYLKCPNRDDISESYVEKKNLMISRVENILMSAFGENIVKIPKVQTGLNPIKELLSSLYQLETIPLSDFYKRRRYKKNTENYLKFLKSLDYIKIEDDKIYPGNELNKYDMANKTNEFSNTILKDVIMNGYSFIKQFLKIQILTPYLELSSAYYLQAHFAERIIRLNHHQLGDYFYDMYPQSKRKPPFEIFNNLTELYYAGILGFKDNTFYGNEVIFNGFENAFNYNY